MFSSIWHSGQPSLAVFTLKFRRRRSRGWWGRIRDRWDILRRRRTAARRRDVVRARSGTVGTEDPSNQSLPGSQRSRCLDPWLVIFLACKWVLTLLNAWYLLTNLLRLNATTPSSFISFILASAKQRFVWKLNRQISFSILPCLIMSGYFLAK